MKGEVPGRMRLDGVKGVWPRWLGAEPGLVHDIHGKLRVQRRKPLWDADFRPHTPRKEDLRANVAGVPTT